MPTPVANTVLTVEPVSASAAEGEAASGDPLVPVDVVEPSPATGSDRTGAVEPDSTGAAVAGLAGCGENADRKSVV